MAAAPRKTKRGMDDPNSNSNEAREENAEAVGNEPMRKKKMKNNVVESSDDES